MMPPTLANLVPPSCPTVAATGRFGPVLLAVSLLAVSWFATAIASEAVAQSAPSAKDRLIERHRSADAPLRYDGRVRAARRATIATRIDGVVETIHFSGGDIVKKDDLLFSLDPTDAQLALQAAEAGLQRAEANLTLAEQNEARVEQLMKREAATLQRRQQAEADLALARAELAAAEVAARRARIDLARTEIRAPIAGRITGPRVNVAAFIEADETAPLAEILQIDRVVVAYDVPYIKRLEVLDLEDLAHFEAMLPLVTLRLRIGDAIELPEKSKPQHLSSELNDDGTITVRALFDNPKGVLRPGLRVQVISELDEEAIRASGSE